MLVVCTLVGLVPARARADTNEGKITAQALFDQAIELMKAEVFTEACPKLRESMRLDPAGGTSLNLGYCLEREGKVASAYAAYADAASYAVRDARKEREALARARMQALEPRLPRLWIALKAKVPALTVTLDDVVLGEVTFDAGIPLDPGAHRLAAHAPGYRTWEQAFEAPEPGKRWTLEVPQLEPEPAPQAPAPAAPVPSANTRVPAPSHPSRTLQYVFLGTGAGLLAVGSAFGIGAASTYAARDVHCIVSGGVERCSARGNELKDQATSLAWVTNGIFAGAIVALTVGGVLYFTTGKTPKQVGVVEW